MTAWAPTQGLSSVQVLVKFKEFLYPRNSPHCRDLIKSRVSAVNVTAAVE